MINVHIYFPEREADSHCVPVTLAALPRVGDQVSIDPAFLDPEEAPRRKYTVHLVEHTMHPKRLLPVKVYLL